MNGPRSPKEVWTIFRDAVKDFLEDKALRLSAALSYYSLFSIGPLVLIAVAMAGLVFGAEAARGQVVGQLSGFIGTTGAEAVQEMLAGSSERKSGILGVVGAVTLLVGAGGVFAQLKDALNTVWEVKPAPGRGFVRFLKTRFLSMATVLGIGFLLLVSLLLSAFLSAAGKFLSANLPGGTLLWAVVNFVVSFVVIAFLFGALFKLLPDVELGWRDVAFGAVFTALLFVVGKTLIGLYLGRGALADGFGAAGSLVVVLVWVYYSAAILLFGAEITQVWANRYGSRIVPAKDAVPVTAEARAQQGMPPRREGSAGETQGSAREARGT